MLNDVFSMPMPNDESKRGIHVHENVEKQNENATKFYNLLKEVEHDTNPANL